MSQLQPTTSLELDEDIVRLLRTQDSKGLHHLLQKYAGKVRNNLKHELGAVLDAADLEEVLNQAAYQAWSRAGTYSSERGKLGTWFYIIARHAALQLLKSEKHIHGKSKLVDDVDFANLAADRARTVGHGQSSLMASSGVNPSDADDPAESQSKFVKCVHECIDGLSPLQQKIIRADLKSRDVADAADLAVRLKTSTNAIYASRSLARKQLKAALQRHGYFQEESETST